MDSNETSNGNLDSADLAAAILKMDGADAAQPEVQPGSPEPQPKNINEPAQAESEEDGDDAAVRIPIDGDDDSDPSEDEEEDPSKEDEEEPDHHGWRKRVDKLTAKRRELEASLEAKDQEVAQLREELKARVQVNPAPTADDPLADVRSPQALAEKREAAMSALDWLLANPYGGELETGDGKTLSLSAEDVAERRAKIERIMQIQIPARERWIQEHAQINAETAKVYPDLFKPGPQSDAAFDLLHQYPELARRPDYVAVIGDLLVGRAVRNGKALLVPRGAKSKAADAAAPGKKAPAIPPTGGAPAAVPAAAKARNAATEQFLRTGETSDLARALEARDA